MRTKKNRAWFAGSARGGSSSFAVRYGVALLLTLGALLLRHGFSPALQHSMLFAFFAVAIALSAGLGGLGPGLFATALSTLLTEYWFIEPSGSFAINGPQALGELVTFLVIGGLLSLTVDLLRRAWRHAGEQENRFRILFERSAMGSVLADPASGHFLLVNPKFCEITGYREEELLGMTVQSLIHPEDREESQANFERLRRGEISEYTSKMRFLGAGSHVIWIEALVTLMHAPGGQPLYCIANIQDITRRKQMDDAVRESEARFRQVLHAAGSAIIGLDPAGRVTMYNGFAEQIFGYTAEEVLGRDVVGTIVPPRDAQGRDMRSIMDEMINHVDQHLYHENENLTKDGRRLWIAWTNRPILDEGGRLREIISVGLDQTERKRTEEALRQSEERFRAAYEHAPLGLAQVAIDGRFLDVNETLCSMLGYTREELLGKTFIEITHPEDRTAEDHQLKQLRLGAIPSYQLEKRYLRQDGGVICVRVTSSLTRQPPVYRLVVIEDITLRRQAEALQSERTFLRQVLDATPSLICVKDWDGRFLLANEALSRCYGTTAQGVVDHTDAEFSANAEELACFRSNDQQVISTRQTKVIQEEEVTFANGEVHWFSTTKVPLIDPDGTCNKVLVVASDITERKRAEESLLRANAELAQAAHQKDEFLAMLAHELRNPLAPIRNAVQILRMTGPKDQVLMRQRDIIERQVAHMARLVDDLLDVTRITRGTVTLKLQPIKLSDVLACAVETASPLIEARRHELTFSPPADELRVNGDFDRLIQIVGNLLNNAAKYTEEGGRIWLTAEREGAEAVIRVRDTGVGLAPDLLPRVFDVFTQAERSLDRSQGGLGLGLTLVRSLVQMHGGSVEAHSAGLGQGSEFVVRLPALPQAEAVRPVTENAPDRAKKTTHRILVVDDVADTANSLAELLSLLGHQVRTAYDGHAALRSAHEFQPDVILLDLGLPGMDGFEVARQIRHDPALEGVMLVALTGYGQNEDRQQAEQSGFDRLFTKPVDMNALQAFLA